MSMEAENERVWYYAIQDGTKYGPYTDGELVKLIRNGILHENDGIWMVHFDGWVRLGDSIYNVYMPHGEEVRP